MRISRFSPNWSDPDDLEAITVAREDLIADAVDSVRESALTKSKHHFLFVGPRGAGKTHLITLVHNRITRMDDVMKKLRVAWLNEDETSDSLLSLLLRAHRALAKEYPDEFPPDSTEPVYDLTDKSEATEAITYLILKQLGKKTLLLLVENLDALFHEFGDGELKRWRALIQNHPQFCTVATAQRLFHGVSDRDAPFFGFFQVTQLKPFTVGQAATLLEKVARQNDDTELAKFIASSHGRARIRALHHLTGGNQRLFIILSEFINRDSLDSLVRPFEELVDEQLTPYYQERLRWLPTLQRKIVEFLCSVPKPTSVKDIARHLFSTSQTISSQLKELRSIGYLESQKRGRESLYELAEPLMRLSHQVKEAKGRTPLRLLVDFLRVWYDHDDLEDRLKCAPAEAAVSKMYFREAHALSEKEGNLRLQFFLEDAEGINLESCDAEQLELLLDLKEESGDPQHIVRYGLALGCTGNFQEALPEFTAVVEMDDASNEHLAIALLSKGTIHAHFRDYQAAIDDYSAVLKLDGATEAQVATALKNRGFAYDQLGNTQSAIDDYSAVLKLDGAPLDQIATTLLYLGMSHDQLRDHKAAIDDYSAILNLNGATEAQVATALLYRGASHGQLGDHKAAIDDYSTVLKLDGAPIDQVAMALHNRGVSHIQHGDFQIAMTDYSAVLDLEGAPVDQVAMAHINRGVIHGELGNSEAEIDDYATVLELDGAPKDQVGRAFFNLAEISLQHGDWEQAYRFLHSGFASHESSERGFLGDIPAYIETVLDSGNSPNAWKPRTDRLIAIYAENQSMSRFASGLVDSTPTLKSSNLSPEGLDAWHLLWVGYAKTYPELELPARLLRTAIDYFNADEDASVLLDLPSEERRILTQALGLEKSDANPDSDN